MNEHTISSTIRIAYCTNVRLPSERAHGHQIAQVCDALTALGHAVTILAPYRRNIVQEDYRTYYGARRDITITYLNRFDPINHRLLPGVTALWVLNALLRRNLRILLHSTRFDLIYTRSAALLSALLRAGPPVLLELHQLPRWGHRRFVRQCNACRLVVCLTSSMCTTLVTWGVGADRLVVAGDAVDLRRFASLPSREEARQEWALPHDGRLIVGYVGRLKTLGMEKGVGDLLKALTLLQSSRQFFGLIVGGPEQDRLEYERIASTLELTPNDVRFTGEVPASRVPALLAACDILAMPFPDVPHYRTNMSPLKMFEYMAADRPIVTSDLPTVRDVLSEETAFFCSPGDRGSLAQTLRQIKDSPAEAAECAHRARQLVESHTWEERMRRILKAASVEA